MTGAGGYLRSAIRGRRIVAVEPAVVARALRRARRARTRSRASARLRPRCSTGRSSTGSIAVDDEDALETARLRRPARGRAGRHLVPARRYGRALEVAERDDGARRIAVVLPDSGERYVSTPFFAPEAPATAGRA